MAIIRELVRLSQAQIDAGGGQQDVDYMLDRPPYTRYYWNGSSYTPVSPITWYTAAQLSALAAAGTLTPFATYVASDDPDRTPQTAKDAYTLIPAAFNSAGTPWSIQTVPSYFGAQPINLEGRQANLLRDDGDKAAILGVFANGEQWNNVPPAASVAITASITDDKLTVSAVGLATNQNGSTLPGAVNRGHYITTSHANLPADTYIVFDPTDTGDHGVGVYTLSAAATAPIASQAFTLSSAKGIGGVLTRITDSSMGSAVSVDADAQKVWQLSIKPTHRVTSGHGRAQMAGNPLSARSTSRMEAMFRFQSVIGSWQFTNSSTSQPSMAIMAISVMNPAYYDANQYVVNGPFAINYNRGALEVIVRTPDEEYAKKQGDGFWNWGDPDRMYRYDQEYYLHYCKGTEPIKVVVEVFLDERMRSEGGRGWLKCWINNRLVTDYFGPTMYPAGRVSGLVDAVQPRLGMYDITYPVAADNTLCSTIRSTATERLMNIKYWRVKEIA